MPRVHIAWPWELGLGGEPEPDDGDFVLVDENGYYLMNEYGDYIETGIPYTEDLPYVVML